MTSIVGGDRGQGEGWDEEVEGGSCGEEGRAGARTDGREGDPKRTRRRTSPLLVRRWGEAAEATAGGDSGGGVLSIMVVLRVDVADLRFFNPKVQTGASFLIKVNFN